MTLSFPQTYECHKINLQRVMILVHTEVIYGIREVNPLTPMTVQEGEDITITVGLLGPDSPNLDDDFVVGYTVKILYGGVHGNATGILYYILHLVHSILLIERRYNQLPYMPPKAIICDCDWTVVLFYRC